MEDKADFCIIGKKPADEFHGISLQFYFPPPVCGYSSILRGEWVFLDNRK
jgi:hypothetical protein